LALGRPTAVRQTGQMVAVWDDPEWIANELERIAASAQVSGVRVAYRMQLKTRATELAAEHQDAPRG